MTILFKILNDLERRDILEYGEEFETKTIDLVDKQVTIKYCKKVSFSKLSEFISDTQKFIRNPVTVRNNKILQQIFHVVLIVKNFTDFEIDTTTLTTLAACSMKMLQNKSLSKIIEGFDKGVIDEINEFVTAYSLRIWYESPKYLNFKELLDENESFSEIEETKFEKKEPPKLNGDWKLNVVYIDPNYSLGEIAFFVNKNYGINPTFLYKKDIEKEKTIEKPSTDELLEEYSDYIKMYEEFSDTCYLERAQFILKVLKGEVEYDGI